MSLKISNVQMRVSTENRLSIFTRFVASILIFSIIFSPSLISYALWQLTNPVDIWKNVAVVFLLIIVLPLQIYLMFVGFSIWYNVVINREDR